MATQKQVAKAAGTSLKTVSRVINKDPLVAEATRKRIQDAIDRLGYTPSVAARMMRSQESHVIGFLANEVATTASSTELIKGAQHAAWRLGKQLMLFNVSSGDESENQAIEQLVAFRAEAVIYASVYHREVDLKARTEMPLVLLNCFDTKDRHPAFVPDDYAAAFSITQEALRRGARKPLFLNVPSSLVAGKLRRLGFMDAGRAAGIDLEDRVFEGAGIAGDIYHIHAYETIIPHLSGSDRPDVVLCGQDRQALQVYLAAAELGLKIGHDMAVISFDNEEPICSLLRPGLSTIALPYYEMGIVAVEAAIGAPFKEKVRTRLSGTLVDRQSFSHKDW
jgi:LacI family transcriptional regulator